MSDKQILLAYITQYSHSLCLGSFWLVNKIVLFVTFSQQSVTHCLWVFAFGLVFFLYKLPKFDPTIASFQKSSLLFVLFHSQFHSLIPFQQSDVTNWEEMICFPLENKMVDVLSDLHLIAHVITYVCSQWTIKYKDRKAYFQGATEASLCLQLLFSPENGLEILGLYDFRWDTTSNDTLSSCYYLFPFLCQNNLFDTGSFKLLKMELLVLPFYCFIQTGGTSYTCVV